MFLKYEIYRGYVLFFIWQIFGSNIYIYIYLNIDLFFKELLMFFLRCIKGHIQTLHFSPVQMTISPSTEIHLKIFWGMEGTVGKVSMTRASRHNI